MTARKTLKHPTVGSKTLTSTLQYYDTKSSSSSESYEESGETFLSTQKITKKARRMQDQDNLSKKGSRYINRLLTKLEVYTEKIEGRDRQIKQLLKQNKHLCNRVNQDASIINSMNSTRSSQDIASSQNPEDPDDPASSKKKRTSRKSRRKNSRSNDCEIVNNLGSFRCVAATKNGSRCKKCIRATDRSGRKTCVQIHRSVVDEDDEIDFVWNLENSKYISYEKWQSLDFENNNEDLFFPDKLKLKLFKKVYAKKALGDFEPSITVEEYYQNGGLRKQRKRKERSSKTSQRESESENPREKKKRRTESSKHSHQVEPASPNLYDMMSDDDDEENIVRNTPEDPKETPGSSTIPTPRDPYEQESSSSGSGFLNE